MLHPICPEGITAEPPLPEALAGAMETGGILRAMCIKCDERHNLHLDLGTQKGIILREEAALGIAENCAREISILSRVGKPVSFQVLGIRRDGVWLCSRRAAQIEARSYFLSVLKPGDILPATVQNASHLGVFCDIGGGFSALMRLQRCCISRFSLRCMQTVSVFILQDCSGRCQRLSAPFRALLLTFSTFAAK